MSHSFEMVQDASCIICSALCQPGMVLHNYSVLKLSSYCNWLHGGEDSTKEKGQSGNWISDAVTLCKRNILTGEGARKLQMKWLIRCLISTSECNFHSEIVHALNEVISEGISLKIFRETDVGMHCTPIEGVWGACQNQKSCNTFASPWQSMACTDNNIKLVPCLLSFTPLPDWLDSSHVCIL